jgi:surface carbohydrate biosynthesis protein
MYYHSFEIPLIKPDIILLNNIGEHNIKFVKKYKSYGCVLALLNSEEGIRSERMSADHPLKMAKLFKKKKYHSYIDLYFCWGSYVANFMKKYSGIKKNQIIISGCPKYDLCSKKIREKIFSKKILYDVMINTNFQATNSFHGDINLEKEKFRIYGMDKNYVDKLFNAYNRTFDIYLKLTEPIGNKDFGGILNYVKEHMAFDNYRIFTNSPFLTSQNAKHRYVIDNRKNKNHENLV